MTIAELFKQLNQSRNFKYVILENWRQLPSCSAGAPLLMLVNSIAEMREALVGGSLAKSGAYYRVAGTPEGLLFNLIEEGNAYLPSRFERTTLATAVVKELLEGILVSVPDLDREFWIALHQVTYDMAPLDPIKMKTIKDYLATHVGETNRNRVLSTV